MSILSDFFVATPGDAQEADIVQSPVGRFPCLRAARADVVKIVQLQCIVDGSRFADHVGGLGALLMRANSDDGPWLAKPPDSLFEFLSTADSDRVLAVGTLWAETDEWRADGGTPDNVVPFLGQICQLARLARDTRKELYVWISL